MDRGLSPAPHAERGGPVRRTQARSPRARRPFPPTGVWLLLVLLQVPSLVLAEQPLLSPTGLHGGRYVGLAHPPSEALRLASSLGYGYTESVLGDGDHHHRLSWELYGAWLKWPALQLSVGSELRYDAHKTASAGSDTGLMGSTRVTTRHALRLRRDLSVAAQPSVLFPGATSARDSWRGSSVELSALASYTSPAGPQLGLSFGYRIDHTRRSIHDAHLLTPSDALAASLSAHNAYLVGALVAFPLHSLRGLVEFSWDLPDGGPLRAIESPMRLRAALQKQVSARFVPGIELGFDGSARPAFDPLVRIEPKVWARIGVSVLLDPRAPPLAAPVPSKPETPPPALPTLTLSVIDVQGKPVAGASVIIEGRLGEQRCDEQGRVVLELPPSGLALRVEAQGYEPARHRIRAPSASAGRLVLRPRLPAGEIKGVVRSLSGQPLHAHVEVLPLGLVAHSDAQGQFVIGVAPGDYTLRISSDGYESQDRPAQVELRGVTILVVDLHEAQP